MQMQVRLLLRFCSCRYFTLLLDLNGALLLQLPSPSSLVVQQQLSISFTLKRFPYQILDPCFCHLQAQVARHNLKPL
jgi:hypothetical protein